MSSSPRTPQPHRPKPRLRPLLALAACLSLSAVAATPPRPAAGEAATRIPEVHTTTLVGKPVNLPAQLRDTQAAVLILGFSKESRIQARDWGQRLAADYATSSTVLYFEMPVLASVPRLLRPWVLRQIAADVSDRGKPHFAPITENESQWRALAHVADPGTAYVLVVNRQGDVVSLRSGAPSDLAYAALRRDLDSLHHAGAVGGSTH